MHFSTRMTLASGLLLTLGLETKYLTKHTVTVSYSNFIHSKAYADNLSDRDFVSLNYIYSL